MASRHEKVMLRFERKASVEYNKKYTLRQRIDFCNRWNALLVHAGILDSKYFRKIRHIEACYS